MSYDELKFTVESLSGGKNTVILDDVGKPSIMVAVPKLTYADVITGGSSETLPAFIVDGEEKDKIWVSKYQNIVVDDRAYSLAGKDPKVSITYEEAQRVCSNKGDGWHLMTNSLWGAIMAWCVKNGTMPHGNTNYGKGYTHTHEKGVASYIDTSDRTCRIGTGSGPATWYHDHTDSGIADLCGNVDEWVGGFRTVYGEIQIIPEGNAMKLTCDSSEWKAIMPDGSLVAPGTSGTLKYVNATTSQVQIGTVDGAASYGSQTYFGQMTAVTGTEIPDVVKALGLFPIQDSEYGRGYVYTNRSGAEYLPRRGSHWYHTSYAGLPYLNVSNSRAYTDTNLGFRSAFYE